MLITCPSCGNAFDVTEAALHVKATVTCTRCRRVIVVRDAHAVPPGKEEATVPFDPGTEADVEPVPEEQTDVAGVIGFSFPPGKRVALAFLNGPRAGDVIPLAAPRVVLGRPGSGADIELADAEASRAHAAIECRGSRIVLRDLGSRNGSFVGETRIESRELENRSEFRLASSQLMLIMTDRE